jgi:hypothetical protein
MKVYYLIPKYFPLLNITTQIWITQMAMQINENWFAKLNDEE